MEKERFKKSGFFHHVSACKKNLLHDPLFRFNLLFGNSEFYTGIKRIKEKRFSTYIGEKEENIKCSFKKHQVIPHIGSDDTQTRIEVRECSATHIFIIEDGICIDVHTFPDK